MSDFSFRSCFGEVPDEVILNNEKEVGIIFPRLFKEIIQKCDGGCPKKDTFYYRDMFFDEDWVDGVACFLRMNESPYVNFLENYYEPPEFFPEGLVAFAENGGGDYICFDYRKGKNNPDPPIVFWRHDFATTGKDVSFIANNFEEFIGMLRESED